MCVSHLFSFVREAAFFCVELGVRNGKTHDGVELEDVWDVSSRQERKEITID